MAGDLGPGPDRCGAFADDAPVTVPIGDRGQWPMELLGQKALGLLRMAAAKLSVPPFFVLTSQAHRRWREAGISTAFQDAARSEMQTLEAAVGRPFGAGPTPLLVAVRASRPPSVPCVGQPALNVGASDTSDGWDGLWEAIHETFESWDSAKAKRYRKLNRLPEDSGLAIVVQAMVTTNGDLTATGRVLSRRPEDGSNTPTGTWSPTGLPDATDRPVTNDQPFATLEQWNPTLHERLSSVARVFERQERCAQHIEFLADEAQLYLLQSSPLQAAPLAAARIHLDMVDDGILDPAEAAARLAMLPLAQLDTEELAAPGPRLVAGKAASPGIGSGICVRDSSGAPPEADAGGDVILVRPETSPRDLPAMKASRAIVTERGDEASHAAIVAREYGIPCVVGCGDLGMLDEGAALTVDGYTGHVYAGRHSPVRVTPPHVQRALALVQSHQNRERT
jgi:pyruvate,orthophosphate dikinase